MQDFTVNADILKLFNKVEEYKDKTDLGLLSELNELAYMGALPKNILDRIKYNPAKHSGVDVFVKYKDSRLVFVLELMIPYEEGEYRYISCEEMHRLMGERIER